MYTASQMEEMPTYSPECNILYSDMLLGTTKPKSNSLAVILIVSLKPLKNLERRGHFQDLHLLLVCKSNYNMCLMKESNRTSVTYVKILSSKCPSVNKHVISALTSN